MPFKSPYLGRSSSDFNEIEPDDKYDLPDRSDRKNYKYQKSKTAAAAVLKKQK